MIWFLRVFPPLFTILALAYWTVRFYRLVDRKTPGRFRARLLLLCLLLLGLPYLAFALRSSFAWTLPGPLGTFYRLASAVWILGSVLAFSVVIASAVLRRGLRLVLPSRPDAPVDHSRRQFVQAGAAAVSLAPWVVVTYGVSAGRLRSVVEKVPVRIPNLPEAFEGFRILQLTDVHISEYMRATSIERFVAAASELQPDVAVLTGDYLAWDQWGLEDCVAVLSQLSSKNGILGCLGNHEIYTRAENRITHAFDRRGVDMLRGEARMLERGSARLNVIGVDYQRVSSGYLKEVPGLMAPGAPHILLSHNPNVLPAAAKLGIDLTLSGHTHGGQIQFEILDQEIAPSLILSPYVKGLYRENAGQLYVSRGIGTSGPPIRLGAPPEITLIELHRKVAG